MSVGAKLPGIAKGINLIPRGCFEHYTSLRLHDASFAVYEKAHEWLMSYDLLSGAMRSEREYAIIPYLSHTLSPFFHLFASKGGGTRIERPAMDWEVCHFISLHLLNCQHVAPPELHKDEDERRNTENPDQNYRPIDWQASCRLSPSRFW